MWPNSEDFELCKSYKDQVSNEINSLIFKNVHCAICNFQNMTNLLPVFLFKNQLGLPSASNGNGGYSNGGGFRKGVVSKISLKQLFHYGSQGAAFNSYKDYLNSKNMFEKLTSANQSQILCEKRLLERVVIFENGSAYSESENKWFSRDEIQVINTTSAWVCIADENHKSLSPISHFVTTIVFIVSLILLALHVIFYFLVPKLQNWHGRNLLCLCCSLFLAKILLVTGIEASSYNLCLFLSLSLHYWWLASFFWMNILSFDIWKTFKVHFNLNNVNKKKLFIIYSAYGWGIPFVIIVIALILDANPEILTSVTPKYAYYKDSEKRTCWINNPNGLLCFFLVPVGVVVMENIILFISTSVNIYKQAKESEFAKQQSQSFRNANSENASRNKVREINFDFT